MSPSNEASPKGNSSARAFDESDARVETGRANPALRLREHLRALVDADHVAPLLPRELDGHGAGSGGDVEHRIPSTRIHPRDEKLPPPRVLTQREQAAPPVVARGQRREQRSRLAASRGERLGHGPSLCSARWPFATISTALRKLLVALAEEGEELAGIVPAEPQEAERTYLCAFASGDERTWLVLDDAEAPVTDREAVRRGGHHRGDVRARRRERGRRRARRVARPAA